jgi:outer membrane receptor protein involved in Fe transport
MKRVSGIIGPLLFSVAAFAAETSTEPVISQEPMVIVDKLLTDSPATVTTIDFTDRVQTAQTLPQLAADTANFFISSNDAHGFNDTYALRGLTNTPIFGTAAISVYLDDLPLGSGFTFPTDLTGFTRAELHRGPTQDTVFGRAGSAGVLTLRTPDPTTVPSGEVRASFGNFDARTAGAQVGTAANQPVDAYVSAAWFSRDGYITNSQLGRDIDSKKSLAGLARLRYRPSATAEWSLLLTGLRVRDGVQPLVPLGGPFFEVSRSAEGVTDLDAYNVALSAAVATPIGRLTATTSFNDWELGPYSNTLDFGFAELANDVSLVQRTWNEEVKLASDEKSDLRWQVGAFYSDERTDGAFLRAFGPYVYEQSSYRIDGRDLAAFGEATMKFGALSITGGARVEDSRKEIDRVEQLPVPGAFSRTAESTAFLPKLAANYAVNHDLSVFASVGAGYKPGGFSGFTGNRALAAFGPERTTAFEGGVTRVSPDRRLTVTARAFWYAISGYQIERSFATGSETGDDYLVVNAPRARSLGGELELNWKPVAGLSIAVAAGGTDVTLTDFHDPYSGSSYDGKRAPYVPAFDASLRVDYQHTSGFFIGTDLVANGRTYYTESEDLTFGQRSYVLLGARLGYASGRYRVTVFGENLGDERYYSAISAGTYHGTPGAPRTYGVELAVKW